jgi:hypothetical protein
VAASNLTPSRSRSRGAVTRTVTPQRPPFNRPDSHWGSICRGAICQHEAPGLLLASMVAARAGPSGSHWQPQPEAESMRRPRGGGAAAAARSDRLGRQVRPRRPGGGGFTVPWHAHAGPPSESSWDVGVCRPRPARGPGSESRSPRLPTSEKAGRYYQSNLPYASELELATASCQ